MILEEETIEALAKSGDFGLIADLIEEKKKKKKDHGPPAPSDIQSTITRYYDDCREKQPNKGKEYCARVAWQRFCMYKNPDHSSCTEYGRTKGKPYSAPIDEGDLEDDSLIDSMLGERSSREKLAYGRSTKDASEVSYSGRKIDRKRFARSVRRTKQKEIEKRMRGEGISGDLINDLMGLNEEDDSEVVDELKSMGARLARDLRREGATIKKKAVVDSKLYGKIAGIVATLDGETFVVKIFRNKRNKKYEGHLVVKDKRVEFRASKILTGKAGKSIASEVRGQANESRGVDADLEEEIRQMDEGESVSEARSTAVDDKLLSLLKMGKKDWVPVTDISRDIRGVHFAKIQSAVKRLLKKGLIKTKDDPHDGEMIRLKESSGHPRSISDQIEEGVIGSIAEANGSKLDALVYDVINNLQNPQLYGKVKKVGINRVSAADRRAFEADVERSAQRMTSNSRESARAINHIIGMCNLSVSRSPTDTAPIHAQEESPSSLSEEMCIGLDESEGMGSKDFCEAIKRMAKTRGKYLNCDHYNKFSGRHDQVIITFINLKEGQPMGGPDAMNLRYQITVEGFGKGPHDPPPRGKVKANTMTSSILHSRSVDVGGLKKMRGKTAKPEAVAKYVADYITKLAKLDPKQESEDDPAGNIQERSAVSTGSGAKAFQPGKRLMFAPWWFIRWDKAGEYTAMVPDKHKKFRNVADALKWMKGKAPSPILGKLDLKQAKVIEDTDHPELSDVLSESADCGCGCNGKPKSEGGCGAFEGSDDADQEVMGVSWDALAD